MPTIPTKKTFLQKQFPTLIGLVVLVVALGAGMMFIATGPGVFAPRATPQTTPKNIKLSNVTDNSFTVSFLTDEATAGFIKYGSSEDRLNSQASDDRDQLSGSVGKYTLHHITLRGLDPSTTYYYSLGTGSGSAFDNNGQPFKVATAKRGGTPSAAKTAYGTVNSTSGTPAEGSIVYVTIDGVGEMSSLVKNSGSWAIPLSNARSTDGSSYADIKDTMPMTITVQGPSANQTAQLTTTVAESQPVATISLGANGSSSVAEKASPSPAAEDSMSASGSATNVSGTESETATNALNTLLADGATGGATSTLSGTSSTSAIIASASTVVDLTDTTTQTVLTSQPVITGQAAPNVKINVKVNSENEYEFDVVADGNGGFTLDLAKLQAELEPGEHTVEYSYVDPNTGKTVTKVETFFVANPNGASSTQLALASPKATTSPKPSSSPKTSSSSATPFGSGNPFPIGGASASPSASPKASAATSSGRVSNPATTSGVPVSGSVGTTVALIGGGIFFILAAGWSFLVARNLDDEEIA